MRDFHSRILLALYLKDYNVIIGSQDQIVSLIDYLPPSIYFDKSLAINKLQFYKKLVKRGFHITSMDEEGLSSYNNTYKYITQRISSECLELADKVFTWGDSEKKIITEAYPEYINKIFSSGNIRVDLNLHFYNSFYKDVVDDIIHENGDYIFFPSSFTVNHALGNNAQIKNLKKLGRISSKQDEIKYKLKNDFFAKTFHKYSNLAEDVSKAYPNKKIIVRPHPSEDRSFWIKMSERINNLIIRSDLSVAPWIIGSKAVIHSSCTTGLESFLLNKPTFTYLPYNDNDFVNHIANDVSKKCFTTQDVLNELECINEFKIDRKKNNLYHHLQNYNGDFAAPYIAREINKINITKYEFENISITGKYKVSKIISKLKEKMKNSLNPQNNIYSNQKYPGSSIKEVELIIEKFQRIIPEIRLNDYNVRELGKNIFLIN